MFGTSIVLRAQTFCNRTSQRFAQANLSNLKHVLTHHAFLLILLPPMGAKKKRDKPEEEEEPPCKEPPVKKARARTTRAKKEAADPQENATRGKKKGAASVVPPADNADVTAAASSVVPSVASDTKPKVAMATKDSLRQLLLQNKKSSTVEKLPATKAKEQIIKEEKFEEPSLPDVRATLGGNDGMGDTKIDGPDTLGEHVTVADEHMSSTKEETGHYWLAMPARTD